jgi:ABC-type multidrug transport system fused ATPase/permease subunit
VIQTVTGFLRGRAIIVVITLLVALGSALVFTRYQNDKLRESNRVLQHNAEVLEKQLASAEQTIVAVEATGERRQDDQEALRTITQAIRQEDVTSQCANSPAVQRVLTGLRQRRSNVVVTPDSDSEDDDGVP